MLAICHFRDRAVAAPLKRHDSDRDQLRLRNFRDRAVAAPLKRLPFRARVLYAEHFRDRAVAAPLKPERTDSGFLGADAFPRPRGRGPIEARWGGLPRSEGCQISATARSRPH